MVVKVLQAHGSIAGGVYLVAAKDIHGLRSKQHSRNVVLMLVQDKYRAM